MITIKIKPYFECLYRAINKARNCVLDICEKV